VWQFCAVADTCHTAGVSQPNPRSAAVHCRLWDGRWSIGWQRPLLLWARCCNHGKHSRRSIDKVTRCFIYAGVSRLFWHYSCIVLSLFCLAGIFFLIHTGFFGCARTRYLIKCFDVVNGVLIMLLLIFVSLLRCRVVRGLLQLIRCYVERHTRCCKESERD